ncbi:helix-turn-helix transcriptional regulator [Actinomadura barringtoniae]|uniref:Helix-turn-helix transcriptional regulator n=1 Tax=Actinomadura barringtoniae TaxID=1427535 RepID=A0A939P7R3_9ACTN|nr:helix-turn-helix transcriptional regulator [Actinomadura barringtoniae]MBO2447215.1 helix-turn-helix transcriptional regulator [Actinomadura barringtoniae]
MQARTTSSRTRLTDPTNRYELLAAHLAAARHEILAVIPAWPAPLRRACLRPRASRGPHGRIIVSRSCLLQVPRPEDGPEIRLADDHRTLLLVIDRRSAVHWDPANRNGTGPTIRPIADVAPLVNLFEDHWSRAAPLGAAPSWPVSDLEQRIVRHLASGMTDEAAANALRISTRTVQRHVRTMMERHGARSRLELGVHLANADLV